MALLAVIVAIAGPARNATAATGINKQINFQGKLVDKTNGTNIANGTYNMEFKIWDASSAGSNLWTETRLVTSGNGVLVTDGIFQVSLGSVNPITGVDFNTDNIYLGINLGSVSAVCTPFSSCTPDGEMSPRVRFTSSPYSFNTDLLDGIDSTGFAQIGRATAQSDASANTGIFINKSAGTNILDLQNTTTSVLTLARTGDLTVRTTTDSVTALVVKNNATKQVFAVDTTGGQAILGIGGASGLAGKLVFNNITNTNTLTLQAGATASSIALTLPTTAGSSNDCLKNSGTAGTLTFATCAATLSNIQSATGVATLSNAANAIAWTWQLTGAGTGFSIGETAASTGGGTQNQFVADISTLAGSTASPLRVTSNSTTGGDIVFNLNNLGNLQFQDAGTAFLTLDNTGGYSYQLDGTDNPNYLITNNGSGNVTTNLAGTGSFVIQTGGSDALRLNNNGSLVYQSTTNSTSAFQLQSTGGSADTLLKADTQNNRIVIGNATGTDTNSTLLVVDNTTTDPTTNVTNGSIIYNSSTNRFRCYQNGAWADCITSTITASSNATASFISGKANVPANTSGQAVERMVFTSATGVSNTAGSTGAQAATSGSFRSCLVKNNAAITSGSLSLRWTVNGVSVGSPVCQMDNSTHSRDASSALDTAIVEFVAGDTIGVAFDTDASFAPTTTDFTVYWTVEYYSTGGNGLTQQFVYDSSNSSGITTTNAKNLNYTLADTATDANFLVNLQCTTSCSTNGRFAVQNGGTDVLTVSPNGGDVGIRPSIDSNTAFKIQNVGNVSLFTVDSINGYIYIGNPTPDATATLLVLDNKDTSSDPAAGSSVNGAMYYDSNAHRYRCYRGINATVGDGAWENCGTNPIERSYVMEDEFISGGTTTNTIGNLNWALSTVGAACAAPVYNGALPLPTGDHPGILRFTTSATINTGCTISLGTASTSPAVGQNIKSSVAVGTTTTNSILRVGLHNETTATTQPTTGVWWEANVTSSVNWRYCYTNAGPTPICAASATVIAADSLVSLEIRVTALGVGTSSAEFFINGVKSTVSGITINTTNRVAPAMTCINSIASARNCAIDYYQFRGGSGSLR